MYDLLSDKLTIRSEQTFVIQQVSAPGKLYIAGEYAILEPGQAAIIVALDAFLTCTVAISHETLSGTLLSPSIQSTPFHYSRPDNNHPGLIPASQWPKSWAYVLSAIETVEQLMVELGRPLQNYHIHYQTDLVAENGHKYGLGSSGAVTVSTVKALLQFYGYEADSMFIYKLAAIASIQVSAKGSLGDVAASSFGGWIYYQSPNRHWLQNEVASGQSISQLLLTPWPSLAIEPLNVPATLDLVIGWTDAPASTDQLVQNYQQSRDTQSEVYQQFLANNLDNVKQLAEALQAGNLQNIQKGIARARMILRKMTQHWQLTLETDPLKQLIEIAQSYQYEAKTSGAGGGDCGIAIGDNRLNHKGLINHWQQVGIYPLPYKVTRE